MNVQIPNYNCPFILHDGSELVDKDTDCRLDDERKTAITVD